MVLNIDRLFRNNFTLEYYISINNPLLSGLKIILITATGQLDLMDEIGMLIEVEEIEGFMN